MLPNLLIPGAPKSGTTSLHSYLSLHPSVYMLASKEPHFFSHDEEYSKGIEWYERLFSEAMGTPVRGESSTSYMAFPKVVDRIAGALEAPKFIFLLRNPIERIASQYHWLQTLKLERRSLRQAVSADANEAPDWRRGLEGTRSYAYYLTHSRYSEHLTRFTVAFGLDQILVLSSEELESDPVAALQRCTRFLGIPDFDAVVPIYANQTRPHRYGEIFAFVAGYDLESRTLANTRERLRRAMGPTLRRPGVEHARASVARRLARLGRAESIEEDDRAWLRGELSDDVQSLRRLTGRNFAEWAADFPLTS